MRPRFSLRFVLLLAACVSLVCYWLFVHPTVIADRFARAIESKDYNLAESMCVETHRELLGNRIAELGDVRVNVTFYRRRWRNFWKRNMLLQVIPNAPNPKGIRVGYQADLAATPFAIQRSEMYFVTFE
jgi:hypothetical protein